MNKSAKLKSHATQAKAKSNLFDSIITVAFYLLFFLTPLLMNSATSELFEFNKMMFVYFVGIFVTSLWYIDIFLNGRPVKHYLPFDILALLFLASQAISTIFSIDIHTSLFGYYGRFNGGLLSIITYLSLFYVLINYFNLKSVHKLLSVSLASSVLVILWGLPGKFGYDLSCFIFTGQMNNACWTDQFRPAERVFSTLGQPNWLGAYLAIHFFIALYFLYKDIVKSHLKLNFSIVLLTGYLVLNFVFILFTRSRSALIAVLAAFVFNVGAYIFINLIRKGEVSRKLLFSTGLLCIAFVIFMFTLGTGIEKVDSIIKRIKSPVTQISPQKPLVKKTDSIATSQKILVTDSYSIRKIVWEGALELGNKFPITGTGVETFAYSYYFTRPQPHNLTSEWDYLYNKAHNEFLNFYATTGLFGLLSYVLFSAGIMFIALAPTLKTREAREHGSELFWLGISMTSAIATIHITNFFGFSTVTINMFLFIIPGIVLSAESEKLQKLPALIVKGKFIRGLTLTAVGLFALYLIVGLYRYYQADLLYSNADKYVRNGDYQQAATDLQEALSLKNEHVYQDKLSYVLANLSYIAAYQKEAKLAENLMNLAIQYNKSSLQAAPFNILYAKTTAKNEYLFYQIDLKAKHLYEGLNALTSAEKLAPTDPKLPYTTALFYSLLTDEEKDADKVQKYRKLSLQAIEKSIQLKPDFKDSYFLKGQLQKKYGLVDEAKTTFQYIIDTFDSNDKEVLKELESL